MALNKGVFMCTRNFILAAAVLAILSVKVVEVRAQQELPVVPSVDLNQYLGKWYEIAAIPQSFQKNCVGNTTAEYSIAEDELIKVINSCDKAGGNREIAEGRAKVVDATTNAKLRVTFVHFIFWIFKFGGDYWIIDLAADYSYAVVGHPDRTYAWILSRTPAMEVEQLKSIEMKIKSLGYDTCQILTSVQNGGLQDRIPLCQL